MTLAADTLSHVAQQVGLVAGILLSLGVIGRAGVGSWRLLRKAVEAFSWLEDIHKQLSPDDGASLHDILHRLDRNDHVNHRNIQTVYGVVLKAHAVDPMEAPLLENLEPEQLDAGA